MNHHPPFARNYLQPFNSVLGQVVLAVVAGFFAVGLGWMSALSRTRPHSRLLTTATPPGTTEEATP